MIWLLKYWRYAAGAALLAGLLWGLHSYGQKRFEAGAASVQARWDADEAEEKRVADEATAQARMQDAADAARNEVIISDYEAKVAAAESERDRTLRLLQRARTTTDTIRASQVAGLTEALGASEEGRDEAIRRAAELDGAIADLRKEAGQNADQLDALIAEVKPQM